jgi:hypothetical protein
MNRVPASYPRQYDRVVQDRLLQMRSDNNSPVLYDPRTMGPLPQSREVEVVQLPENNATVEVMSEEEALRRRAQETNAMPSGDTATSASTPSIYRTETGGVAYQTNPLEEWKNSTTFLDRVRQVIAKRQKMTQDLGESKAYWQQLRSAPSAIGAPETEKKMFGDMALAADEFRYLSPNEQQNLIEARRNAADAHLGVIADEERVRGARMEDTLSALADIIKNEKEYSQEEREQTKAAYEEIAAKRELGLPITEADLLKVDKYMTRGRLGGTAAWRNNNPLNIKYEIGGNTTQFAKWLKANGYDVIKGTPAQDGGAFISFNSEEAGLKAAEELLFGDWLYRHMTPDAAMRKWSGNGYGAEIFDSSISRNKTMSELGKDPAARAKIIAAMRQREGWAVGTTVEQINAGSGAGNKRTQPQKDALYQLAAKTGVPLTLAQINAMSEEEFMQAKAEVTGNVAGMAYSKIPPGVLANNQIYDKPAAIAIIDAHLQGYSIQQIKDNVKAAGGTAEDLALVDRVIKSLQSSGASSGDELLLAQLLGE